MFEGIITNILNRILGDFIEGIKADQLSISLLSGDVELFDLSIKPDILDNMPLPFKLKYGKVGRIFVDVPVTSLLSSPLKIEVSEIFMLVEPKEKHEWNADIIEQAFVNGTQSSLNNLEEYFKGKLEIQNSEPGMASNMINSIIDNVQIDIRNIYLRFEDSISNPKMPYSLGICLEAIQLYTCNNQWMRDFVSGKDISLKMAKITNFQIFLNFSDTEKGSDQLVRFEDLTEDMHIDDVMDDEIRDLIMKRQEKGVTPNPTIVRTKNFLFEEIMSKRKNRNLIEKFCIEARIKLNKDPKKNEKPQLDINLVIGGKFKEGKKELVDDDTGIGFFKLQQQQMKCILKYLDYSTEYTKFQTGVQKQFLERKFSKEESKKYMKIYEEWKMNEGENKSAAEKKKAEKLREEMKEIEKDYAYETVAAVRQIAINKYNLEFRKNQERETMQRRIKQFENERAEGWMSGLWGGKSDADKEKDNREIQEFKQKLSKEFEEKFAHEENKMNEDMEDLLQNEPIFDQDALKDMPDEWTRLIALIVIPKLRFVLLNEDSEIDREKSIMEMQSSGMKADAKIGQDWQDIMLSFGRLNIIDNISGSDIYQFLTETVFPGGKSYEGRNAVELQFRNNPRFEDGQMKVKLRTMAHQYIFANMPLIKELQEFFAAEEKEEDKIDLSYYTDRAKMRALEYINQGADYLEEVQKTEYVHTGIQLDVEVFAPVLVIPESICDLTDKKTIVFNLGYINVSSDLRPYHRDVDYKLINRGEELYDQYNLTLNGFQLSMIEELVDYKNWENAKNRIEIINQISINLRANRAIEPEHPVFPSIELFCKINEINIFFSDYIMANLMKIQKALLPPAEEKKDEEKENEKEEESKEFAKQGEEALGADGKKKFFKKIVKQQNGRTFDHSDDEEKDEEEGEENFDVDEKLIANDVKSISAKSMTDVENNPENQLLKTEKPKSTKVDQRILILFDKMKITLGEVVSADDARTKKFEPIIDHERSEIPHVNILEMFFEGLEIEVNNGETQNINLIMNRL